MPKLEKNIYRITKKGGCDDCPFKDNGKSIHLKKGRVDSIKKTLLESDVNSFNCHKTLKGEGGVMMCAGAFEFLEKKNKPNVQMKIAYELGIEKEINHG